MTLYSILGRQRIWGGVMKNNLLPILDKIEINECYHLSFILSSGAAKRFEMWP